MVLPAEAVASGRPSRRAQSCYATVRWSVGPLLRRGLDNCNDEVLADRMTALGERVASVSRLQRRRRFSRRLVIARDTVNGIPIETVRTPNCVAPVADGVVFYLHGGGFCVGNLDSHLETVSTLAWSTGLPVVHVDYRQHPHTRIDGSVSDSLAAYRWLLEQGADPTKVVFGGDSAGGFLAFATVQAAQQHGLPSPVGVFGISPLLERDSTARSGHVNASRDPVITASGLGRILSCVSAPAQAGDLSPVNGDLEAFPPALIIAAESEVLRCDAERMHDALTAAGRACTVKVWPGQVHAFPAVFPFLPESRAAFEYVTRFVLDRVAS